MRALTKKQKSLIAKWFRESGEKRPWESTTNFSLKSADDLTLEHFEILEKINDTEVLYMNINCFINELHTKALIKTGWYD